MKKKKKGKRGSRKLINLAILLAAVAVIIIAVVYIQKERLDIFPPENAVIKTMPLDIVLKESQTVPVVLESVPYSIQLTGSVTGSDSVKIYAVSGETRVLVLDSSMLKLEKPEVSDELKEAMEIRKEVAVEPSGNVHASLEYNKGSKFDPDDDGITSKKDVIDFKVSSSFDFEADQSKICTKWEVFNIDEGTIATVCRGGLECCHLCCKLKPDDNQWDSIFNIYMGRHSAGENNVITARVMYTDFNAQEAKFNAFYSESLNLPAVFTEPVYKFETACIDSCTIKGFEKEIQLEAEVPKDTSVKIKSLSYLT